MDELKPPYGRLLEGWRRRGSSSSGYSKSCISDCGSAERIQVLTSESEEFRRRPRQLRQMPMNERRVGLYPPVASECKVLMWMVMACRCCDKVHEIM